MRVLTVWTGGTGCVVLRRNGEVWEMCCAAATLLVGMERVSGEKMGEERRGEDRRNEENREGK